MGWRCTRCHFQRVPGCLNVRLPWPHPRPLQEDPKGGEGTPFDSLRLSHGRLIVRLCVLNSINIITTQRHRIIAHAARPPFAARTLPTTFDSMHHIIDRTHAARVGVGGLNAALLMCTHVSHVSSLPVLVPVLGAVVLVRCSVWCSRLCCPMSWQCSQALLSACVFRQQVSQTPL